MTKKIPFAGFVALLMAFSVRAQQTNGTTAYPSISTAPFGDATRHWYFIADPSLKNVHVIHNKFVIENGEQTAHHSLLKFSK